MKYVSMFVTITPCRTRRDGNTLPRSDKNDMQNAQRNQSETERLYVSVTWMHGPQCWSAKQHFYLHSCRYFKD